MSGSTRGHKAARRRRPWGSPDRQRRCPWRPRPEPPVAGRDTHAAAAPRNGLGGKSGFHECAPRPGTVGLCSRRAHAGGDAAARAARSSRRATSGAVTNARSSLLATKASTRLCGCPSKRMSQKSWTCSTPSSLASKQSMTACASATVASMPRLRKALCSSTASIAPDESLSHAKNVLRRAFFDVFRTWRWRLKSSWSARDAGEFDVIRVVRQFVLF